MSDQCVCGHNIDEHDPDNLDCQVFDCPCIYFEDDPDADDFVDFERGGG